MLRETSAANTTAASTATDGSSASARWGPGAAIARRRTQESRQNSRRIAEVLRRPARSKAIKSNENLQGEAGVVPSKEKGNSKPRTARKEPPLHAVRL